jgi:hypothetical protein
MSGNPFPAKAVDHAVGRVDIDEVDAGAREFPELVEVVAAIDDAGVEDGDDLKGKVRKFMDQQSG